MSALENRFPSICVALQLEVRLTKKQSTTSRKGLAVAVHSCHRRLTVGWRERQLGRWLLSSLSLFLCGHCGRGWQEWKHWLYNHNMNVLGGGKDCTVLSSLFTACHGKIWHFYAISGYQWNRINLCLDRDCGRQNRCIFNFCNPVPTSPRMPLAWTMK